MLKACDRSSTSAHGRGEFRANDGNTVYKGEYVRGRRQAGTWFFDDGSSWEGDVFPRQPRTRHGGPRRSRRRTRDGAYVVVDRKLHERDAIYHDNRRAAFVDELKKGCGYDCPPFGCRLSASTPPWWEGPPNLWNGPWRRPSGGVCARGRRALRDQRGVGLPRRGRALRKNSRGPAGRSAVPPALRPLEHGARGRPRGRPFRPRRPQAADPPLRAGRAPGFEEVRRDGCGATRAAAVADAHASAGHRSATAARTLSQPVSRESTVEPPAAAQPVQGEAVDDPDAAQLPPAAPPPSKALTLDLRVAELLLHHANFYEFKVKEGAAQEDQQLAACKAYPEAGRQRRPVKLAGRGPAAARSRARNAARRGVGRREEADFEAQMRARIIVRQAADARC